MGAKSQTGNGSTVRILAAILAIAILAISLLAAGCAGWPWTPLSLPQRPPAPAQVPPFAMGQPDLVLMVTGRSNGILEVCNCSGSMSGGLSRRSGMVLSYRQAFPHTLLVDSGDMFWIESQDVRNDYLLQGYAQIGYDAIALGDQEWSAPPARLRQLLSSQPLPYLSTGIDLADDGPKLPLRRQVARQWGPLKVAVLSDIGKPSMVFMGEDKIKSLAFQPEQFARRARQLKAEGYVIIGIAHTDEEGTGKLALSGLTDLVIRGHCHNSAERLQNAQGTDYTKGDAGVPVVRAGGNEMVGVVAMKISGARITAMEYRLEPAGDKWPEDKRLLQTYQAYAHAALREALDAQRKAGLEYVPSEQCGQCHRAQYEHWTKTRHSQAYKTLADAGRAGDPNCLMCHTSGFGTAKGFYSIQATPRMANVNCQDCHRFDIQEHHQKDFIPPKLDEEVCASCHTAVTDPKFNFEAKEPRIACPKRS
jgi:hypothetical protein